MDRLTAKATPEGILNYTFDAAGHVASIASNHVNGASMSYTYDSLNRLSTVVDNRLNGATTTYSYDNASNVATVTYPNGVKAVMQYDALNRITALATQQTGYSYQRGPTGNLTSALELNGRSVNWTYDGIYRLTNETISLAPSKNNGAMSYGLDPVGNRTSVSSGIPDLSPVSGSFNPDDELSSESYDQNGNVTASGGKIFGYDSQNQMASMTASGTTVSMTYDAFGNRVGKTVNGAVTRYLVEDDVNPTGYPQVLEELNGAGAVTRTYTYGLQRIDEEQILNGAWTPSYYGYDGGGNVRRSQTAPVLSRTATNTTPSAIRSPSQARRPTTTSIAANNTTRIWACITSAPDTTTPPPEGSCHATQSITASPTRTSCTSISMPTATRSMQLTRVDKAPCLKRSSLQWPRLKVAVKVAAVGLLIAKTMCWLAKVVGAAVDWALGGGPTPMASPGKEFCNALSRWGSPLL